jgi:translation initiation factor 2B subunit (eIF-2B alpha/beta/delta family)
MPTRKATRRAKPARHEGPVAAAKTALPTLPAIGAEDMFQLNKTGFDVAVKLSNAIVEGFEHIREMQMHSAHEVHEKNDKVMRDLMQIRNPADLSQLQMELVRFNMQRATQYWQQMFSIGNEANAKLVEEVKNECIAANEKMNRALGRATKSADKPAVPAAPDTMKMAMDMTNMTLTNMTKVASQWMDTAKHSLDNISATRH